jgi:adenylosuccinate lyase
VERAGLPREQAYEIAQRASLAAADQRRPLRELLALEPVVARSLSLAELDACFDDARYLSHVPVVIARLDALIPTERAPERPLERATRKATADAHR